jgi:protein phosphatase
MSKRKIGSNNTINVASTHHIGARENQQDSFGISNPSDKKLFREKGAFGAVADGLGGMSDGAVLSVIAVNAMLQYFDEVESTGDPSFDLLKMLFAADDGINRFLSERGSGRGGTTVAAVIINKGKLYWVSAGDSRIYLARGGGVLQLNRAHTYAAELDVKVARGELSRMDAASDDERESLTSYLGNGRLVKVDRSISPAKLIKGDKVLLMTDGVFGVLSEEEITEAASLEEPQKCVQALESAVLEKRRKNQDNFTAVVFEYTGA